MRRRDLLTGGFAGLLTPFAQRAQAQDKYPSRAVRLIVPTPAGGVYDLMAVCSSTGLGRRSAPPSWRIVPAATPRLAPRRGAVGAGRVHAPARQQLDAHLPARDDAKSALRSRHAVCAYLDALSVLGLHRRVVQSLRRPKLVTELIAYAKNNPGTLTYGMRGVGDVSHMTRSCLKQLVAETFRSRRIPYSAMAQAVRDLMTGDLIDDGAVAHAHIWSSSTRLEQIRLLAVTSTEAPRASRLTSQPRLKPGVPTCSPPSSPLFAPSGTPIRFCTQLNVDVAGAPADDEFQQKLLAAASIRSSTASYESRTRVMFESGRPAGGRARSRRGADPDGRARCTSRLAATCVAKM